MGCCVSKGESNNGRNVQEEEEKREQVDEQNKAKVNLWALDIIEETKAAREEGRQPCYQHFPLASTDLVVEPLQSWVNKTTF